MLEQASSKGAKLAALALSGLLSGLAACSGAQPNNEVVVDPTAQANTPATTATAATATATATETEAQDTPDPDPPKRPRVVAKRPSDRNCCKGKNECKGLGGCKTDLNECMGKNDCKGKGGCKSGTCEDYDSQVSVKGRVQKPTPIVVTSPNGGKMCCKGQNACKGLGNCKTNNNACAGLNNCKGLGGCAGPCTP